MPLLIVLTTLSVLCSTDNQTSVTMLHKDLSDAVNVCIRVVKPGGSGVVVRCGDARADRSPGSM